MTEVMAPSTAGQLMRRLNARQCQVAVAELAKIGKEVDGEVGLTAPGPVTLDLDSSDTEVYGRLKHGSAFNHRGQRSYDSQVATWAERRRILAAELRSGNLTDHPTAIKVLRRALKALPEKHGLAHRDTAASASSWSSRRNRRRGRPPRGWPLTTPSSCAGGPWPSPAGCSTADAGWCCDWRTACSGPRPSSPPTSAYDCSPRAPDGARRGRRPHSPRHHGSPTSDTTGNAPLNALSSTHRSSSPRHRTPASAATGPA